MRILVPPPDYEGYNPDDHLRVVSLSFMTAKQTLEREAWEAGGEGETPAP